MTATATPSLPPTKQCVNPDSDLFGAVAVWSERLGRYGVMNPGIINPGAVGGHWADDLTPAEDWADLPTPEVQQPAPPQPQNNDPEDES